MPVDMANIQWSIAAIGREFWFPLDHSPEDDYPIDLPEECHGVVEFVHNLKRFMSDQHQILTLLNKKCRAHHWAEHNAMVKNCLFQPGDVVLCHHQV
jgi:hypothetical protein